MTEPLLAVEDLAVIFTGGVRAVDGVSLSLDPGATLGVVGESGSGKTTLAKAIIGLIRPSRGRILLEGRDVHAPGGRRWRAHTAQMIFQDPAASLSPRLAIRAALTEPLKIQRVPRPQRWPRVERLMRAIGLGPALLDKYPHQLSGGQARRVAIARALVAQPRLIVADEPTAGLDLSVQGDLLNLLNRLQQELGLTYLLISHNLSVIRRVTDRVAVMYLGEIVELAPTRVLFAAPAHPYTEALVAANPTLANAGRPRHVVEGEVPSPAAPPPGCRFHPRCPYAQERCRIERPVLRPLREGRLVACHFPRAGN